MPDFVLSKGDKVYDDKGDEWVVGHVGPQYAYVDKVNGAGFQQVPVAACGNSTYTLPSGWTYGKPSPMTSAFHPLSWGGFWGGTDVDDGSEMLAGKHTPVLKCTCGGAKLRYPSHSEWCDTNPHAPPPHSNKTTKLF